MTVAATASQDFTVDTLITMSMHSVGLLNTAHSTPTDAGDLLLGRRLLFMGIQALQNDGIVLRASERATYAVTASVAFIDTQADTLSIEKGAVLRSADGLLDRPIEMATIARYQQLTNKTVAGVPSLYAPEQTPSGGWRIYLYPTPEAGWPSLIVPRTRRLRDVDQGSVTLDLNTKWLLAILKFLGGSLARAKGRRDLATEVLGEYRDELARAENDETERGDGMLVASPTPWDDWC
jgi:hypothetical protein